MDKRRYEYFLAIAEEKSISKAADRLFITQPSLSKFLINLEKELDTELFHRSRNSLSITPSGERYLTYVKDVLTLHEDLMSDIEQINISSNDTITLGVTPWLGSFITSKIIEQFHLQFPYASLKIVEDSGPHLIPMFEKKKLDLFLSIDLSAPYIKKCQYQAAKILCDRLLLIVPKNHPVLHDMDLSDNSYLNPSPLDLKRLKHSKLIMSKPSQLLYVCVDNIVKKYGLSPQSCITTQNINNILRLTDSGLGISFIPQIYVKNGPPLSNSAYFSLNDPLFDYIWMAYYRQDNFIPLKRELIKIIQDICKNLKL